MRKKRAVVGILILLAVLLAGCSNVNQPINAQSTGFWSRYFVYPLSEFIIYVAHMFWDSYGIAIIITTIIVRLVLLPLMAKQVKSSQAMQDLQPKIKALQEKYSSKDRATQEKLQQEQMKLFQENKVNPLSGCLPLLIQMPILFAFYQAIMRTWEIKKQSFLWFQLGAPDPFYILPIIAALSTFLQQKIMVGRMGNSNPQMAMMTYVFPIMIAVPALYFPSALALYWVVGNIFMIFQTYFIYEKKDISQARTESGGAKKK
ncbi:MULTISPECIES: YidC family membrane integrase SpoIIIJ [unclassified Sporolactobacillus]|uniref:YidC family membrane integrase SpoIIIJ n=1 Tax=unclassified Sporolactobacillus TaxID=2628533 RepID=UPI002367DA6B|nr:YidC family membrane integrase SpoIIIJ [Sporolactobacillus sp. CQH2019]MDD9148492.1 YidC family membrane integrase SpoIIIJ [Sporolactobacillus sp. CQH2019]